jgi:hypothetical protein
VRGQECRLVEEVAQRACQVGGVGDREEQRLVISPGGPEPADVPARLDEAVAKACKPLLQLGGGLDRLGWQAGRGKHRDQAGDGLDLDPGRLAGGVDEPVVEERVVGIVEALALEGARDQHELLEELDPAPRSRKPSSASTAARSPRRSSISSRQRRSPADLDVISLHDDLKRPERTTTSEARVLDQASKAGGTSDQAPPNPAARQTSAHSMS